MVLNIFNKQNIIIVMVIYSGNTILFNGILRYLILFNGISRCLFIWSYLMKNKCNSKISPMKYHEKLKNINEYDPNMFFWNFLSTKDIHYFQETNNENLKEQKKYFFDSRINDEVFIKYN